MPLNNINNERAHSPELNADEKNEIPYWTVTYKYPKDLLRKAIEGISTPSSKDKKEIKRPNS